MIKGLFILFTALSYVWFSSVLIAGVDTEYLSTINSNGVDTEYLPNNTRTSAGVDTEYRTKPTANNIGSISYGVDTEYLTHPLAALSGVDTEYMGTRLYSLTPCEVPSDLTWSLLENSNDEIYIAHDPVTDALYLRAGDDDSQIVRVEPIK